MPPLQPTPPTVSKQCSFGSRSFVARVLHSVLILAMALGASMSTSSAQSPAEWVQSGRALLTTSNLSGANNAFAKALQGDPTRPDANALHATTRLVLLWSSPAVSNLLTRLGMPTQGRSVYHWTAPFPHDAEGRLALPPGVLGSEVTTLLRSSVLPELIAAESELARITNPTFLLRLSANETKLSAVDIDLGDILLSRALFKGLIFWIYTTHSWDLEAPARVLTSISETPGNTVEDVLARYPSLLSFATTNDMVAAQATFSSLVDLYVAANTRIVARLASDTRLFNTDNSSGSAQRERKFRFLLQDLKASLDQATLLRVSPPLRARMDQLFTGKNSIRSLLPDFQANTPVAGTLPDSTFGGFLLGLDPADVPYSFNHRTDKGHRIRATRFIPGAGVRLDVNGHPGMTYEVLASDDLSDSQNGWFELGSVFPSEGHSVFLDTDSLNHSHRFYALLPSSRPQNDDFEDRLPLRGSTAVAKGWNNESTTEATEPEHPSSGFISEWGSIWWSWTAPRSGYVVIDACSGSYPQVEVYTGSKLTDLELLARSQENPNYGCSLEFFAEAGVAYSIAAGHPFGWGGQVRLQLDQVSASSNTSMDTSVAIKTLGILEQGTDSSHLVDNSGNPAEGLWWSWTAPSVGRYWIKRDVSDEAHGFTVLLEDGQGKLQWVSDGDSSVAFDAIQSGHYFVLATRRDSGNHVAFRLDAITAPRNDEPDKADPIPETPASLIGSSDGATVSSAEPSPQGKSATVWWRFTAPSNGYLSLGSFSSDFEVDLGTFEKKAGGWTNIPWNWTFSGTYNLSVTAGRTYYIRAGGWDGESGRIVLRTSYFRF